MTMRPVGFAIGTSWCVSRGRSSALRCGRSESFVPAGKKYPGFRSLGTVKMSAGIIGPDPVFAQTMLRVKDPVKSREFYERVLGMKYLTHLDFPALSFSLHFYAYADNEEVPGEDMPQAERAQWLWSRRYPTMELTHNYGTEDKPDFSHHSGNEDPLGFGHIGILVDDVQKAYSAMEKEGVQFAKAPGDVGGFGAVAFAKDPDGYWVELIRRRTKPSSITGGVVGSDPVLCQTMLRIKEPQRTIQFYEDLGMKLLIKVDVPDQKVTNYFMGYTNASQPGDDVPDADRVDWLFTQRCFTLQLTHIWGTENDPKVAYHNGNTDPQGFGHIGLIVDDVYKAVEVLEKKGYPIKRKASPFQDAGVIAFTADPDGYFVELITRNGSAEPVPYSKPVQV